MRGPGPGAWTSPAEQALALREHLELSDAQIAQLDQLRQEHLEQRQSVMAELMQIRSDVAAGTLTRADARELIRSRRSEAATPDQTPAEQLTEVLSEEQMEQFRQSRQRGRRGQARVRGGQGGQVGPRGGRGFRRGQRFRRGPG